MTQEKSLTQSNDSATHLFESEIFGALFDSPEVANLLLQLDPKLRQKVMETLELFGEMSFGGGDSLMGSQVEIRPVWESVKDNELCRDFVQQASTFLGLEPWAVLPEQLIFEINCEQLEGGPWFAIVLGQYDELEGVAFHRDFEKLTSALRGEAGISEMTADTMLFSIVESRVEEFVNAVELGWPENEKDVLPNVFRIQKDHSIREINEPELAFCMLGLCIINSLTQGLLNPDTDQNQMPANSNDTKYSFDFTVHEPEFAPGNEDALTDLQDALELTLDDWKRFCQLMCEGFEAFEKDHFMDRGPMSLDEIPEEWFRAVEPFGFVVNRVLGKGRKSIKRPVAWHYLTLIKDATNDPESNLRSLPAAGKAFLALQHDDDGCPISDSEMLEWFEAYPASTLFGLNQKETCELLQILLMSLGEVKYWHVCNVMFAVSRDPGLTPQQQLKIFDFLVNQQWIKKAELIRLAHVLLGRTDELNQANAFIEGNQEKSRFKDLARCSRGYRYGQPIGSLVLNSRGLQRRAVRLLADLEGDPAKIVSKFLTFDSKHTYDNEMKHLGAIDVLDEHAEEIGLKQVEERLRTVINRAPFNLRHAAYRVRLKHFGKESIHGALADNSNKIKTWAKKQLS